MSNWRRLAGRFMGVAIAGSGGAISLAEIGLSQAVPRIPVADETLGATERSCCG